MARLFSSGFELNSITANVEWTSVVGATIQTSTVRSGAYAGKISALTSATAKYFQYQFASANINVGFFRFYLNIETLPSAENTIFLINDTVNLTTPIGYITLDNTGVLRLYDEDGQIGSASSALNTGQQYRIEYKMDRSGSSGSHVVEGEIDGSVFATASNRAVGAGFLAAHYGGNLKSEAQTTGVWYFDDIAINDNTGSNQTSYPGSGKIVHLRPNAAGDNTDWVQGAGGTANFNRVNELTPDDATTYNKTSSSSTQIDDFNIDHTPSTIGISDTISLVSVGFRGNRSNTFSAPFILRVKSQASGTLLESSAVNLVTAWATNSSGAPHNYPLISYTDPQAGGAWTKSLIDTAQIGYKSTPVSGGIAWVSNVWALVEYIPVTWTLDNVASGNAAASSLTYAHRVGTLTNGILIVAISCQDSNHTNLPITGVTYNGTGLTKAHSDGAATNNTHSEIWYLLNPASGNNNVVISATGSVTILAVSSSWSGAAQSGQPDATAGTGTTDTTSTAPSQSITSVAANALIIDAVSAETNATKFGIGQGVIGESQKQSFENVSSSYTILEAAAVATMSETLGSSQKWSMSVASFAPVGAVAFTFQQLTKIEQPLLENIGVVAY